MPFTVVVAGFYGSQRRHAEKYGNAWQSNIPGVKRTILNECSGLAFMIPGYDVDAKKILKELEGEKDPVVFHVMSNRGMFVFLKVMRLLPKDIKVAGVIFDSCPGGLDPWLLFKAQAANQKDKLLKILHEIIPYFLFGLFAWRYGIVRAILMHIFIYANQRIWTAFYHKLVAELEPSRCPSLFLYSKADNLVASDLVETVANEREKHIGRVWRKCWEKSAHVRHIYEFEDEYIQEMKQFAQNIGLTE